MNKIQFFCCFKENQRPVCVCRETVSQPEKPANQGWLAGCSGPTLGWNLPGHSIADMRIAVMEKMWSEDPFMRETRESHYIKKMNSKHKGMNRKL